MAMRYCKDCQLYECCMRTPLGGCQEFDNVVTNPTKPMTLEEAKQILEMEVDWDWEKFRREAAKDILCAMLGRVERFYTGVSIDGKNKIFDHKDFIKLAIKDAGELVKQLKESNKC